MASKSNFINKAFGQYNLIVQIANGKSSDVYLALPINDSQHQVAIKVLRSVYLDSPQERDHFLQEAQILTQLKHPNILPIVDVGVEKGAPYIVAEYAPEGSLRDYFKYLFSPRLSSQNTLRILSEIGQAVTYAHERNILHGNIKPENILLNEKNEALLADFDLAPFLGSAGAQCASSTRNTFYQAPEQLKGVVSKESDQYALGCLAYKLFTEQASLAGLALSKMRLRQNFGTSPQLPFPSSLPQHIKEAILKAMAKKPDQRYPSVPAFVDALNDVKSSSLAQVLPQEDWAVAKTALLATDASIIDAAAALLAPDAGIANAATTLLTPDASIIDAATALLATDTSIVDTETTLLASTDADIADTATTLLAPPIDPSTNIADSIQLVSTAAPTIATEAIPAYKNPFKSQPQKKRLTLLKILGFVLTTLIIGSTIFSFLAGFGSMATILRGKPAAALSARSTPLSNKTGLVLPRTLTTPSTTPPALQPTSTAQPVQTFQPSLQGNLSPSPDAADLTAEGTIYWAHWGLGSAYNFNHKSGVPNEIFYNTVGDTQFHRDNSMTNVFWFDGVPAANINTTNNITVEGETNGFLLRLPARATTRVLKIYVGVCGAQGQLTASLDGSNLSFQDASLDNHSDCTYGMYTIAYSAAFADETLTITFILIDSHDRNSDVELQAITVH